MVGKCIQKLVYEKCALLVERCSVEGNMVFSDNLLSSGLFL